MGINFNGRILADSPALYGTQGLQSGSTTNRASSAAPTITIKPLYGGINGKHNNGGPN